MPPTCLSSCMFFSLACCVLLDIITRVLISVCSWSLVSCRLPSAFLRISISCSSLRCACHATALVSLSPSPLSHPLFLSPSLSHSLSPCLHISLHPFLPLSLALTLSHPHSLSISPSQYAYCMRLCMQNYVLDLITNAKF